MRRRELAPVEVLTLRPGDAIVYESRVRLSELHADEVVKQLEQEFPGHKIYVTYNASLKILREGNPPPPPVIVGPATERRGGF